MGRKIDVYGFEVGTEVDAAVNAYDKGARSFVAWRADTLAHLNDAIAADDQFILPKLLKAWILHAARSQKFDPIVDGLIQASEPLLKDATARERAFATGLKAAHAGTLQAGAAALESYLLQNPLDVVAHRLLQFELFWCGESKWMRDVVERAAPYWDDHHLDYPHFLAVRAFSNEEAGDYATAEKAGRIAIELEPSSPWGAHAIAHVLVMQGRIDEGIEWLEGLSGNWGAANQIAHHNWWHLCLFLMETGAHDRILELLVTQIRNPEAPLVKAAPDATIDLQNVAALLMRLELRGVEVGERWQPIADICAGRVSDHGNPFSSAHDAMVLTATGQFDAAAELINNMTAFGASDNGMLANVTRAIGVPLVKAIVAHRKGDYDAVVDMIWPIRRALSQVGGSHAQRDIFYQILVHAGIQANRIDQLKVLLDDITGIGFHNTEHRTLYQDAARLAA